MLKRVFQLAAIVGSAALLLSSSIGAQRPGRDGEWRNYAGDVHQTKYSPLAQINKDNVAALQVAWRWTTADRAMQLSDPLLRAGRNEETPLMVNGVLYTVTGLGFVARRAGSTIPSATKPAVRTTLDSYSAASPTGPTDRRSGCSSAPRTRFSFQLTPGRENPISRSASAARPI
jgi:hypothetical protein